MPKVTVKGLGNEVQSIPLLGNAAWFNCPVLVVASGSEWPGVGLGSRDGLSLCLSDCESRWLLPQPGLLEFELLGLRGEMEGAQSNVQKQMQQGDSQESNSGPDMQKSC